MTAAHNKCIYFIHIYSIPIDIPIDIVSTVSILINLYVHLNTCMRK